MGISRMRTMTTTLVVMSRFDFKTSLMANISSTTPANHNKVGSIKPFLLIGSIAYKAQTVRTS